jgi:hypothetical protein
MERGSSVIIGGREGGSGKYSVGQTIATAADSTLKLYA